ncbi:MAG TPA: toxin-antitoxin system YwqK family antitoxin [Bacteroidales bacterium]|nr:MAG: hypothetical protein A2W98_01785 [Bacteroidetes bacterium GWF2_33_38]OFY76058.1 MAG: hypothetical protein A2265_07085 [Bacteroidetes bacterium RIFOXYA12_FULL_33_9]OFY90020.1 MAG: hypothetical protein A2236_11755 [Bacteroidetes bacterium RIFOXYA2_FULL_33_7]HBF87923.1 toxin-antitoxin system YwqK family antitoxin [Bacteroidales bacterium]
MNKIYLTSIFVLLLSLSALSQTIHEGTDGLYYDESNKLFSGLYSEKFENDKTKMEINIENGLKNGEAVYFYQDGAKKEIRTYKNGIKHGTWINWNEKGSKTAIANYSEDLKDGEWIIWDDNGTKRYTMMYSKGKKVGTWLMWDEKGNLVSEKQF